MGAEHIAQNWRMNETRYRLKGKAQLTQEEFDLIVAEGASVAQILQCSRKQLEQLFPVLVAEPQMYVFAEAMLQAAK